MKISRKGLLSMILVAVVMISLTSCIWKERVNQGPSAVVNIYPAQSELVDENYFYSKWTESKDPEGGTVRYKINYAGSVEGLDDPQFYETAETWFLFPNLEEGVWYWRVTAIDDNGNTTKSPIWTFTVNGETLPQPVDPEEIPTDPALIVTEVENTSFSLDWPEYEDKQNPSTAVEYVIYVYEEGQAISSRDPVEMGQWMARITPATTAHTTDTSYTFNNMQSQTIYDWVIVAQNNASQTSVVGSSQVRTGNSAPTMPELLTPTDGATDVTTDVELTWSASTDPDGDEVKYFVYIDILKNTNRNVTVEGITNLNYQPEGLEEGRIYYWFIMAKDSNGAATRTQTFSFCTQADGMDIPKEPTPADGTENMDATNPPLLEWEHDKNGEAIVYNVYLSSNPKKIDRVAAGQSSKQYQIPGMLEGNTKYYWAIEAENTTNGQTTRSGVWTFKTGIISPPVQTSAITNAEGTQIELTYDKAMGDPTEKKDSFKVKREETNTITSRGARTVTSYQTIATSKMEMKPGTTNVYVLTLESALVYGDKVFMDYIPGTVKSSDGGKLAKYENTAVTNMVPGEAPLVEAATATANAVEVKFDKDMKEPPTGAKTQFSVQSGSILKQIENIIRSAGDTYTLNLKDGQIIAHGETVLISYNKGTVQGENEAYLESFAGIAAENTVEAPAPLFVSGETSEDGLTVKVTFDREMADPTGKQDQFSVNVTGQPAVSTRNGFSFTAATLSTDDTKIIELTLNAAVANGQTITLDYTAGDVQSAAGKALESFTEKPLTNGVPGEIPVCTAATITADGRSIEMGFSRAMRSPTALEANQFGILVNGYVNEIEGAALGRDNNIIILELAKPVGKNNAVHVSYTRGTVSATNGGLLESFQNKQVNTDELTVIWVIQGIGWNYSSIGDAISSDLTVDGDVIMVATGTYAETFQFRGKAITLKSTYETDPMATSTTIIDAQNQGPVIGFITGEDRDTVFEGFTVINGSGIPPGDVASAERRMAPYGGALTISGASPTIRYNVFKDNTSYNGGAVNVTGGNPLIAFNEFDGNTADYGGAIHLEYSGFFTETRDIDGQGTATIYGNLFKNNSAYAGGGIYIDKNTYAVLNAEGKQWKIFNSPRSYSSFVENQSSKPNTYEGNLIRSQGAMERTTIQEGADIYYDANLITTTGNLFLRPETGVEKNVITLNLDYVLETDFSEASLTMNLPQGFKITDGASVIFHDKYQRIVTDIFTHSHTPQSLSISAAITMEKDSTITLVLEPQETPAGTVVNISSRSIDYLFTAKADADGEDGIWSISSEATAVFVSTEQSVNTNIVYIEGKEPWVQLLSSPTSLKVASETSVDVILASIKAEDDSSQTYDVITSTATLTGREKLSETATLVVTAAHGNKREYSININPTPFVELQKEAADSSGRLISRTDRVKTWHDTVQDAVDQASVDSLSYVTLWPGVYLENIVISNKPIHLSGTDYSSQTVIDSTIIDGNFNGSAVVVDGNGDSEYSYIEGLTIRHAGRNGSGITGRTVDPVAGIVIKNTESDVYITHNVITENGTSTGNKSALGIYFSNALSVQMDNNTVSKNYNAAGDGGGVNIQNSEVYFSSNSVDGNYSSGSGGGIVIGQSVSSSARGSSRNNWFFSNTISNNKAAKGAGIAIYKGETILNGDSEDWRVFNVPSATVTFVENNTDLSYNNSYSGNIINGPVSSARTTADDTGRDIWFQGPVASILATLEISPATATGNASEKITMKATCTLYNSTLEGSMTFTLPSDMAITTAASITFNDEAKRSLRADEILDPQTVLISGYTSGKGSNSIVFDFIHNDGLKKGFHAFGFQYDADGTGTLYTPSDIKVENLSIPAQYAAPEATTVSPVEGTELATTTVTFTWEAEPGAVSNETMPGMMSREEQGIDGYVVSFAGADDVWASATVNDGDTKTYATDTLIYGEDYKWHVKAIGANGKTTITDDATFITTYRLQDLGTEGTAWTITDETAWDEYVVAIDTNYLPSRFTGETRFRILVNGTVYFFEKSNFEDNVYSTRIAYVSGTPNTPSEEDIRAGFFNTYSPVVLQEGNEISDYETIKAAVDAIEGTGEATITLHLNEFKEGQQVGIYNQTYPLTIKAGNGLNPVLDGEDAHRGFDIRDSATVTFKGLVFSNFNMTTENGGAVKAEDSDLKVENCSFDNNTSRNGGAVYTYDSNSTPHHYFIIIESTMTQNTAINAGGTGNGGALITFITPNLILKDSYFASNSAEGSGGAVRLLNVNHGYIDGCTFEKNDATSGGGALGISLVSNYEIKNTVVSGNSANSGGGIQRTGTGNLTTNGMVWDDLGLPPGDMQENFSVDNTGAVKTGGNILESDSVHIKDNTAVNAGTEQMQY